MKLRNALGIAVVLSMLLTSIAAASPMNVSGPEPDSLVLPNRPDGASHRLIVELSSPPLAMYAQDNPAMLSSAGKLQVNSLQAQQYLTRLAAEQNAFMQALTLAMPNASVSTFTNELGAAEAISYKLAFNGVTIDPGTDDLKSAMLKLMKIDGVKMVHFDGVKELDTHASIPLIGADTFWDRPEIGGVANAGAGIKVASVDGGIHHLAPMFDGTGFDYPADYPEGGLGLTENNNGKIIVSRAYFRAWDPPAPGDENPWPGVNGTSHGVHTSSTAAGNPYTGDFAGASVDVSGVAPAAWVMSYRVFYASVLGIASVYDAELLAALDDVIADGADVLNNSWGGGAESSGGPFDAVDTALRSIVAAGIFVSMSEGNSGPYLGTGDHPSPDYINVAASTTDAAYAAGALSVTAPEPISDTLQDVPFVVADFGEYPALGETFVYTYVTAAAVDPLNFEGCSPFAAGTFDGVAAVISRGVCEFGVKVLNAENAGAEFVVIHNHAVGGEELILMGPGVVGDQVTIPSVFVPYSTGVAMTTWYADNGTDSQLTLDMTAFLLSRDADVITDFSSRGPGVGMVLKPDIAAPGDYIMAQGYAVGVTGEDRHLGIGQASGTSMAAPHVTGAAALIKQAHPDWSPAWIKSALMSTAKYMDMYTHMGVPAQPLDMGAGRLDLTNAADPGVILDPPSLSFGQMITGTSKSINVHVINVSDAVETYTLTTLFTGNGFDALDLTEVPGVSLSTTSLTIQPGAFKDVLVTFDASTDDLIGDNQGYVVLEGETHSAHMPLWARVADEPQADVLIIQNDGNYLLGMSNYLSYYTDTLDNLGLTYDVWHPEYYYGGTQMVPGAAYLAGYEMILYFTGDNFIPDGYFTVSTPLTVLDQQALIEFANAGGKLLIMGQDVNDVLGDFDLRGRAIGWEDGFGWDTFAPAASGDPVIAAAGAPPIFEGVQFDLSGYDEVCVPLLGTNIDPPVSTVNTGEVCTALYDGYPFIEVNGYVYANDDMDLTEIGIYTTTAGSLASTPVVTFTITDTVFAGDDWSFSDLVMLSDNALVALMNGELVLNVKTDDDGTVEDELRAVMDYAVVGDGAWNQYYVDEMYTPEGDNMMPLLQIPDVLYREQDGIVALGIREQPTLEKPGVAVPWRSIYATFGLEGVNNLGGTYWREDMLWLFTGWLFDDPMISIEVVDFENSSGLSTFEVVAGYASVSALDANKSIAFNTYRWDFGDGSPIIETTGDPADLTPLATHAYDACYIYTVSVEVVNEWGNHAVASIDYAPCELVFLPWMVMMP